MKKLNGSELTKIETSCIHSQIASRVMNVFVDAENEVEFNHDDIINIMGTCIKQLTRESCMTITTSNQNGRFIQHGDEIHYYENGVYAGEVKIMKETVKSEENDVELKQDEAIPSSTQPETQYDEKIAKEVHEFMMKRLVEVIERENNSDKYAAKYLAKETHANGLNTDEQAKNAKAIQQARSQALSLLIDDIQISNNTEPATHILEAKSEFVNGLFFDLCPNDKYLSAKLMALMNAAHKFKDKFRGYIFTGEPNRELYNARELAKSIRNNIDFVFSHLN